MTDVTRHWTATTFVVHGGRVLLHRHRKQGYWLPPGGHIEPNELPDVAARREIVEETGLHLRLHSEGEAAQRTAEMELLVVPRPAFIFVEEIKPHVHPARDGHPEWLEAAHQHIDFVYFALAHTDDLPVEARDNGFVWCHPDDLVGDEVPTNVIEGARRAIEYYAR
jgi:8-oxo-dGTP pyrophosphatase MutT (NUDIX family)